ncbi:MAG: peroxiredoxin-like family protein [Ferruginibacter sp.]
MKRVFLLLVCVLSFQLFSFAQDTQYPSGLAVGDKAPQIEVKDNAGNKFDLKKQLKKGDVIIIFYRGQWCPYCNKELSYLQDSLSLITARGATVIAISPETDINVAKTVEKSKASFPIISDKALSIMKAYKVNFTVDEKTITKYKTYGIDFDIANGDNGANLPVPATYIVGQDGKIKYAYFNTDYRKRNSVQDLLDNL